MVKEEKAQYKANRMHVGIILFLFLIFTLVQLPVIFFQGDMATSFNTKIWTGLVLFILPITIFKVFNLGKITVHYLWICTVFFLTFALPIITVLSTLNISLSKFGVVLMLLSVFGIVFFYTFFLYVKKDKDFIKTNSKDMIDIERKLVYTVATPKTTKVEYQITANLFAVIFLAVCVQIGTYLYFFGMSSLEFFSNGPGLGVAILASIFLFPLSAVIVAKIFYSYYSIRRYEKEHNIKFRSSFVLVEERFKEFNEERKHRGLKSKSLTWAFIRGNLIELMEKEEKR